jgi:hypothetical protein
MCPTIRGRSAVTFSNSHVISVTALASRLSFARMAGEEQLSQMATADDGEVLDRLVCAQGRLTEEEGRVHARK